MHILSVHFYQFEPEKLLLNSALKVIILDLRQSTESL